MKLKRLEEKQFIELFNLNNIVQISTADIEPSRTYYSQTTQDENGKIWHYADRKEEKKFELKPGLAILNMPLLEGGWDYHDGEDGVFLVFIKNGEIYGTFLGYNITDYYKDFY